MEGFAVQTHAITRLLEAARAGADGVAELLWQAVYDELHRIAAARLADEHGRRTLQPTALVHEAYLRLLAGDNHFENRRHFFAAAAKAMRRILIDDARRRRALKRSAPPADGLCWSATTSNGPDGHNDPAELLAIDEALERLGGEDPELARVVELRFFGGLGVEETAETMGIAPRTVEKYWRLARAWLHDSLTDGPD